MKLSALFFSLICILPGFAQSQFGSFGPVPDCNCESEKIARPASRPAQPVEVSEVLKIPTRSRSELIQAQRKMAEKIVARAGSEADVRALDQSDALGFAVPVLEITLDQSGYVLNIDVARWPSNDAARGTVDIAISAVHNAAPYSSVTQGTGLKVMQTFVFKNNRKYYLRALGN